MTDSIYDFTCTSISGEDQSLEKFKGKVLLIVNTASKCGFTPQYGGLESLYKKYADKGLEVLGFPCNQFGNQDPGSNEEISDFCSLKFSVNFPMYAKVDVNGNNADPLFKYLKKQAPGMMGSQGIKWNFTKFLVNSNGQVVKRFASATKPADIAKEIEKLLA